MPVPQRLARVGLVVVERLVEPELLAARRPSRASPRCRSRGTPSASRSAPRPSRLRPPRPRRRPSRPPPAGRCRAARPRRSAPASRARRAPSRRARATGRTAARPRPSESASSRQPRQCTTHVPSATRSLRDATTWPTAPPLITSPTWNGGTYDLTSFIRARMYGSTDMNAFRISTSPVGRLRHVDLDEREVGRLRHPVRAGGQVDLAARRHRCRS